MRPKSTGNGQKQKLQIIIIVIAIVGAIAGVALLLNSLGSKEKQKPYFSEAKILDEKISSGENTHVKAEVYNPGENTYQNLRIQLATPSPKIKMSFPDQTVSEIGGEYYIEVSPDFLEGGGSTKLYSFDVSGELYPGLTSMTAKIELRVLAGGEVTDSQTFNLKITSES